MFVKYVACRRANKRGLFYPNAWEKYPCAFFYLAMHNAMKKVTIRSKMEQVIEGMETMKNTLQSEIRNARNDVRNARVKIRNVLYGEEA